MSVQILEQSIAAAQGVLANVSSADLDKPTPCASWDVKALVNHLVGANYWFAQMVTGATEQSHDEGSGATDFTGGDLSAAYADAAKQSISAFSEPGVMERTLTLPFGPMPAAGFVMMAACDQLQHAWDLARATGQSTDLAPQLADQLCGFAEANIPEAFRGPEGAPFGPKVDVPSSATAADRLAGILGRRV